MSSNMPAMRAGALDVETVTRPSRREQLLLESEAVQDLPGDERGQIVDGFRLLIEGRHGRQDQRAGFGAATMFLSAAGSSAFRAARARAAAFP
jgi:hypothetical protein